MTARGSKASQAAATAVATTYADLVVSAYDASIASATKMQEAVGALTDAFLESL